MQIYGVEQSKDIHRSIAISLHFKRKSSDGVKAYLLFVLMKGRRGVKKLIDMFYLRMRQIKIQI